MPAATSKAEKPQSLNHNFFHDLLSSTVEASTRHFKSTRKRINCERNEAEWILEYAHLHIGDISPVLRTVWLGHVHDRIGSHATGNEVE